MKIKAGHLLALALLTPAAQAGSIYLCNGYSGGRFWASNHCNRHNALIERIVNVPDGLPWDQQVQIGEQQLRGQAAAVQRPPIAEQRPAPTVADNRAECEGLEARIARLDEMARQPQNGQTQDWIRDERKKARDRQFSVRC